MTFTTMSDFGDVVVVAFPFTDQSAVKKRPAVVVSNRTYNRSRPDVILAAITSRLDRPTEVGDIELGDWQEAGLRKPSAIKLVIGTFSKSSLLAKLGSFSPRDKESLRAAIEAMVGP